MSSRIDQTWRNRRSWGADAVEVRIIVASRTPLSAETMARYHILAEAAERFVAEQGEQE